MVLRRSTNPTHAMPGWGCCETSRNDEAVCATQALAKTKSLRSTFQPSSGGFVTASLCLKADLCNLHSSADFSFVELAPKD